MKDGMKIEKKWWVNGSNGKALNELVRAGEEAYAIARAKGTESINWWELARRCNLSVPFCVLYANNTKRRASHGRENKSFGLHRGGHSSELYPVF